MTILGIRDDLPYVAVLYPLCVREPVVKKKKGGVDEGGAGGGRKRRRKGDNGGGGNWECREVGKGDSDDDDDDDTNGDYGDTKGSGHDSQNGEESEEFDGIALIRYCCEGSGLVVEPFPTIYWMVHPVLRKAVSVLEDKHNGVRVLEERLRGIEIASAREFHDKCRNDRIGMLTDEHKERLGRDHPKWLEALSEKGVAGIDDPRKVKCLHTHLAHYLSPGGEANLIGRWVLEWMLELGLVEIHGEWKGVRDKIEVCNKIIEGT